MNKKRTQARQTGFSIVEVLVALVVLGAGMLGVASLYMTTLRASGSAISRMHAVNLASDLAERIRANPTARSDYEASTDENTAICSSSCQPAELALSDLASWRDEIERTLPGEPTGMVDFTASAAGAGEPNTYVITISWREAGLEEPLTYALNLRL